MKLYKITTHFYGKDLDEAAILGHVVAETDEAVYDHINKEYKCDDWPSSVNMTREAIVAERGDHGSEYMGEFYDQKYGWEDLGEVSIEDATCLKRFGILDVGDRSDDSDDDE